MIRTYRYLQPPVSKERPAQFLQAVSAARCSNDERVAWSQRRRAGGVKRALGCRAPTIARMGRLIPAGTGFEFYRNVRIPADEPPATAAANAGGAGVGARDGVLRGAGRGVYEGRHRVACFGARGSGLRVLDVAQAIRPANIRAMIGRSSPFFLYVAESEMSMDPVRSANRRRRPVKRCSRLRQGYGGQARLTVFRTPRGAIEGSQAPKPPV